MATPDASLDLNCYDLLASEARLTSFIAIAKGDVPSSHWFHLGRALTPVDRGSALVSWSGSMFEYLMPALVMRSPATSLLGQTYYLIVRRQRNYGAENGVPWGVSESAYNARDLEMTYQYSNFGVPGLGLKRGLSEDAVVAPYATALAAMIDPRAAAQNFARLTEAGASGRYGFYEALDYTATRVPEDQDVAVVRAYMAHTRDVAGGNTRRPLDGVMRTRFMPSRACKPRNRCCRNGRRATLVARGSRRCGWSPTSAILFHWSRLHPPHDATPASISSNGRHWSWLRPRVRIQPLARSCVTRWREDRTRDGWGTYIFLRDGHSGQVWSAAYQPSGVEPTAKIGFSEDQVEIRRRDGAIATTLEIVVSPEHDAEVRRVSITNLGLRSREIELTSYAEIVLAPPAADAAHPAFSNLFVQTEFTAELGALLATRRPRSAGESGVGGARDRRRRGTVGDLQYETDRARSAADALSNATVGHRRPPAPDTVGAVLINR